VKNEEVLQTATKERDILPTLTRRRLTGFVTSYCCSVIEGKIEGTWRRARRPLKLLDDLKETKKILEITWESTRPLSLEDSPWRRLCTCRKTDYRTISGMLSHRHEDK